MVTGVDPSRTLPLLQIKVNVAQLFLFKILKTFPFPNYLVEMVFSRSPSCGGHCCRFSYYIQGTCLPPFCCDQRPPPHSWGGSFGAGGVGAPWGIRTEAELCFLFQRHIRPVSNPCPSPLDFRKMVLANQCHSEFLKSPSGN